MVVYLDLLFLFNFALNALFLYAIQIIYKERCSILKLILGSAFGGLLIFSFILDYYWYFIAKLLGGAAIGFIGFKKEHILSTILKIASLYIVNFATVGIISSFEISEWPLFFICILLAILVFFIESNKKIRIFANSLKYNISVTFNKKRLDLVGYLDTGNFSKFEDLPIVYISRKYQPNLTVYKMVDIKSVNGISYCNSYRPNIFTIEIKKRKIRKDVLIVFADIEGFDCLLNTELLI